MVTFRNICPYVNNNKKKIAEALPKTIACKASCTFFVVHRVSMVKLTKQFI